MRILGFDKLSLVDYPGTACAVIFLGGCNFRCPFCHNAGIVEENFEEISQAEVFAYLEKRKGLLDAVTITGGEPTLNKELPEFIAKIKELGYKVKLDTNGTNPDMVKSLIDNNLLDYVAMDVKNSLEKYSLTSGCSGLLTKNVEKCINLLKKDLVDYEFRTTLVAGHHTMSSITDLGEMVKGAKRIFLQRFVENENCLKFGLNDIPKAEAEKFKKVLEQFVKDVRLRGY